MAVDPSDITASSLGLYGTDASEAVRTSVVARVRAALAGTGQNGGSFDPSGLDTVAAGLCLRLSRFESALSRFVWPTENAPWRGARLVVRSPGLEDAVTAAAVPEGQAVNPYKQFSAGRTFGASSGLAGGDYTFRLTQGDVSREISVTLTGGESWGGALGKVADAVNASADLSVRADVVFQQTPFTLDPSLVETGTLLALSVNPLRLAQDVAVEDVSGNLVEQLDMRAAAAVSEPADEATIQLSAPRLASPTYIKSSGYDPNDPTTLSVGLHSFGLSVGSAEEARATTYVSTAFDPDAATTLTPGTYNFTASVGGQTRNLSVTVKNGWTWGDVLNAVRGQINGTGASVWKSDGTTELLGSTGMPLPGVEADFLNVSVPSSTDRNATYEGRRLEVRTTADANGQTMSLTDGSGGILTALGLATPMRGQIVTVPVSVGDTWKDVLYAVDRGVSQTTERVYARAVDQTLPVVVSGQNLTHDGLAAALTLLNRRLGEDLSLTDGATGLLSSLGLNNVLPGQDGEIAVDGVSKLSENNAYSLQSGRLLLGVRERVGETLPLTVTKSMDAMQERLGDVVAAYNDVRTYLAREKDALSGSLADRLSAPVAANWSGLSALGFSRTGRNDLLWIANDAFWTGFYNNADAAGATLATAPGSLIPGWKTALADIRSAGVASFVTPEAENLRRISPPRTEFELERKHRLLDLLG